MVNHQHMNRIASLLSAPTVVARYRAVMWEPIEGTGERVVALLSVEPSEDSADHLAPGTYLVLGQERLRAILGRIRGDSAFGVLSECARYMTSRQLRGEPIEQVQPLFRGFTTGPIHQARAYGVDQLLDAAIRTLSAFGSSSDLFGESDPVRPSNRRSAEFLRQIRRAFAHGDEEKQRRFNVRLQREQSAPEVWVDYANGPVVLQVLSVPGSVNQAPPAEAELKSKILDLEVVRKEFDGNRIEPSLLLNVRSLESPLDEGGKRVAQQAHEQIRRYAEWASLRVFEVTSASDAARVLETL
jgi:hypothetical protein